jgi:hypothetical protein
MNKKQKRNIVILISILVVLILAGIAGFYFWNRNKAVKPLSNNQIETEQNQLNSQDQHIDSSLELINAAKEGDLKKLQELIKSGAQVNDRDGFGDTAMIYAVNGGNLDMAKELIAAGADVNLKYGYGVTALMSSAMKNVNLDVVKELIKSGANVNMISDRGKMTAMMYAAEYGETDIVKELIKAGAYLRVKDFEGKTPLTYALESKHNDIAEILKEAIANDKPDSRVDLMPINLADGISAYIEYTGDKTYDVVIEENGIEKIFDKYDLDGCGFPVIHPRDGYSVGIPYKLEFIKDKNIFVVYLDNCFFNETIFYRAEASLYSLIEGKFWPHIQAFEGFFTENGKYFLSKNEACIEGSHGELSVVSLENFGKIPLEDLSTEVTNSGVKADLFSIVMKELQDYPVYADFCEGYSWDINKTTGSNIMINIKDKNSKIVKTLNYNIDDLFKVN